MPKKIILVGYFSEVIELCENAGYDIVGIVDNERHLDSKYEYLGNDQYVLDNSSKFTKIPVFLIPDLPMVRKKLFMSYKKAGFFVETVISPNSLISKSAKIGEGCMVQCGCNISANVTLGNCVRMNSLANVMHDSVIGDFSTLAPSSVILGRCIVGKEVYIGANSTVLPEVRISDYSTVGAGAVVVRNVKNNAVVAGVPAVAIN